MHKVIIIILLFLAAPCLGAERNITLQWDASIDADYLVSYRVHYYTASGNTESLDAADYAISYTLAGGETVTLNPANDPKSITIAKSNTQITLHFHETVKNYFFVVIAIDDRGLESVPSFEIESQVLFLRLSSTIIRRFTI